MGATRAIRLEWTGEDLRFEGRGTEPDTPTITVDGDNAVAPGPMLQLLLAAASCAASDVVLILHKMRVDLTHLSVTVTGVRRDTDPKAYQSIRLQFRVAGTNLDRPKAERAVQLSIDKYCSVVHTLSPAIDLGYDVDVV